MPHYNFVQDLPIAKESERDVAGLLEKIYSAKILDFEDTNKYDILAQIKDKQFTFEVKEDFICERTGNVGLEYECRGKPSGIQTSQADFYVYKLHTKDYGIQYILHKTDALKRMIAEKRYFRIVNGGDEGSNSMNYLFRYNVFVETGKFLELSKVEIQI